MSAVVEPAAPAAFVPEFRRRKSAAFDLERNSTAGRTIVIDLRGRRHEIYANANLSIYSGQSCNARCPFCVEELRPASRGGELSIQKRIEPDDDRYFAALEETLAALRPLEPSVSVTGGEPSLDRRLPRILRTIRQAGARKRTMTTNGSGLLDRRDGRRMIDWVVEAELEHLNLSRAHPDDAENARLMRLPRQLPVHELETVLHFAASGGARPRLSCVLLREGIEDLAGIVRYLDFAERVGVDNVIFRQLMKSDAATHAQNDVVDYSDRQRVPLEPILDRISDDPRFEFVRQIVGYYYYVEVWKWGGIDVVFEEADLAQLERTKRARPEIVHELVFHPNGSLASTWQPWDGVLAPIRT